MSRADRIARRKNGMEGVVAERTRYKPVMKDGPTPVIKNPYSIANTLNKYLQFASVVRRKI